MKAPALILAIALSTSVPSQAQQPTTAEMSLQSARTSQVIQRFNQAFEQHDATLLENMIAEDCVMESVDPAPDGTRVVGRDANLKFWRNLATNKDGKFVVEDVAVFGERADIRWRYHFGPGSHLDAFARWADRRSTRLLKERRYRREHGRAQSGLRVAMIVSAVAQVQWFAPCAPVGSAPVAPQRHA